MALNGGCTGAERGGIFPSTHWTVVLTAAQAGSPDFDQAMSRLCQTYWYPLYAFARRRGSPPEEAEDLTQEFFSRLLQKDFLARIKPEGGKFRSFLLTLFKRFLANEWSRGRAAKRGGGQEAIPMDGTAELRYQTRFVEDFSPETLFDRQWAFSLLDQVLKKLEDEYRRAGKADTFAHCRGCLPGAESGGSYPQIAQILQVNEATVRMSAHRLRRRYGELLRAEIAATVTSPDEIESEIAYLIKVATR